MSNRNYDRQITLNRGNRPIRAEHANIIIMINSMCRWWWWQMWPKTIHYAVSKALPTISKSYWLF